MAKVVMPVGAMEAKAAVAGNLVIRKVHDVGNVREVVIGINGFGAAFHFRISKLDPDVKGAGGGTGPFARRNREFIDELIIFISVESLMAEVDVDALIGRGLAEDSGRGGGNRGGLRNINGLIVEDGTGSMRVIFASEGLRINIFLTGEIEVEIGFDS